MTRRQPASCRRLTSCGGADVPMAWDMPADAVFWRWNVRTGVLTTVHADGSETTRIARTWQSLAVAVDVLESHAFVYFFLCVGVPRRFTRAERTQGVEHRPSLGRGRKVSDRNLPYFFSRACRTGLRHVKCPKATRPFRMSRTANRKCRKIVRWKNCANGCSPRCVGFLPTAPIRAASMRMRMLLSPCRKTCAGFP